MLSPNILDSLTVGRVVLLICKVRVVLYSAVNSVVVLWRLIVVDCLVSSMYLIEVWLYW